MKKTFLAFLLIFALVFAFGGCKKPTHKIIFIVDGETHAQVSSNGNETVTMPVVPQKDGYVFVGWYRDDGVWQRQFTSESLVQETLAEDLKVYAKFKEVSAIEPPVQAEAKVIILSGQSNMFGSGAIADITEQSVGKQRYDKLSNPIKNVKILMNEGESLDDFKPVKLGVGHVWDTHFGPELGVAEYFSDKCAENETVYIIKYALSGTRLWDTWVSPSRKDREATEAYKTLVGLIDNGLQILTEANIKFKIAGFCWMQGESDSVVEEAVNSYRDNQSALAKDLRARYNAYSVGGCMNFVDATIGPYWPSSGGFINQAKTQFRDADKAHNFLLDTQAPDLVQQGVNGLLLLEDGMHYNAISVLKLGQMFAEQIYSVIK